MFRSFFAVLSLLIAQAFVANPAQANITISLGGQTYQIAFLNSNSFNSNTAALSDPILNPWFGDDADTAFVAAQIASQYASQPPGVTQAWVARDSSFVYYTTGVNTINSGGYPAGSALPNSGTVWVTTSGVVAVPEIDAPALFKALFFLFVLATLMAAHRMRQSQV